MQRIADLLKSFRKPKVVTRFAPSPTGFLHAGNYRTAVFSYLYARQRKGSFIVRIEDTDKARSKKEYEDNILDSLKWLGLEYDSISRQSENSTVYEEYLKRLLAADKIYVSKEAVSEEEAKEGKRAEVIRFRNPNKKVKFKDMIRGDIEFDTTELGDFVVARSMSEPVFHFAVVLDDFLSGVTHIVRGEDHIPNTPRHILIQEALGAPQPVYAHLPLVLASDRSKLSKRHGAKSMTFYKDAGFLPAALLNYMCLLGWNPGTEQEIFTKEGLVKAFDIAKVQKGGAIFNEDKLKWVNKEHLKIMPTDEFAAELKVRITSSERAKELKWDVTDAMVARLSGAMLERINTYGDVDVLIAERDLDYYFADPAYDALSLRWKGEADLTGSIKHLTEVRKLLADVPEKRWDEENIKAAVWPYAEKEGRGNVLWPLRFCLAGKDRSPNPFTIASVIGKSATDRRIGEALKKCADNASKPL